MFTDTTLSPFIIVRPRRVDKLQLNFRRKTICLRKLWSSGSDLHKKTGVTCNPHCSRCANIVILYCDWSLPALERNPFMTHFLGWIKYVCGSVGSRLTKLFMFTLFACVLSINNACKSSPQARRGGRAFATLKSRWTSPGNCVRVITYWKITPVVISWIA